MKVTAQSTAVLAMASLLAGVHCAGGPSHGQPSAAAQDTMSLPERNPMRGPAIEVLEAPPHPSEIEADAWTAQEIQEAKDACAMMLDGLGSAYRHIEPLREGVCGTPAPIEISSMGTAPPVAIEPPARMTCGLAASLGRWADTTLQPAALKHLGEPVTAVRNVASYVCRNRYNSPDKPVSEHALANALDMAAFKTQSGTWVTVLGNWDLPPPPEPAEPPEGAINGVTAPVEASTGGVPLPLRKPEVPVVQEASVNGPEAMPKPRPEVSFMREIHGGACDLFGTVLGPDANAAHRDHFHFDLAHREYGNYCE